MRTIRLVAFLSILFVGCKNTPHPQTTEIANDTQIRDSKLVSLQAVTGKNDTIGLLSGCESWGGNNFKGYLQEVKASRDSLGPFCFYECLECPEPFEIIFKHKKKAGPSTDNSLWEEFNAGCANKYENFDCFAFFYPRRDPLKQKDYHELTMDFPLTIKGYERIKENQWKFVGQNEVKSFKELSMFRFKAIYHLGKH